MGKKQPLAAAQKPRAGLDITRFLERKVAQCPGAPQAEVSPDGRHAAGARLPKGQASTPDKHLLDNVLLSQDVDDGGLQVVWASSPTAAYSPQKVATPSQEAPGASQLDAENSQASKDGGLRRSLAPAIHRVSDNGRLEHDPPAGCGADLLEQLLARRTSHAAASTSAPQFQPANEPPMSGRISGLPPMQHALGARQVARSSAASALDVDDQVLQEVLAGTDTYKTPAAAKPARLARNSIAKNSSDYGRPSLSTPSVVSLGCKRALVTSGSKAGSGNKRRALLDLLEQVELMVKHPGPSAVNCDSQQADGGSAPGPPSEAAPGHVGSVASQPILGRSRADMQIPTQNAMATQIVPAAASVPALHNSSAAGFGRSMLPPAARPAHGAPLAATPGAATQTPKAYPMTQPLACPAQSQAPSLQDKKHIAARGSFKTVEVATLGPSGPPSAASQTVPTVVGGVGSAAGATAAGSPEPITLRPPTQPAPSADEDDDDFWNDVDIDIDALVANATSKQASPVGVSSATGVSFATGVQGPVLGAKLPLQQPPSRAAPNPGRPPLHPQGQQQQPAIVQRPQQPTSSQPDRPRHAKEEPPQRAECSTAAAADPKLLGDREEVHFVVREVHCPRGTDHVELLCSNEYKNTEVRVYLKDMWADQVVKPGDTVNIVGGRFVADPTCPSVEVSGNQGLLVLHPDVLLSGTTICTAIRCSRQAWLQERVASGAGGEAALLGSMLHELLQRSLRTAINGRLDKQRMLEEARSIINANTDKLLEVDRDEASVLTYFSQQLDGIIAWCNSYVTPGPASALGGRVEAGNSDMPTFCRVTEVLDIEESIWAPKYGLKGQLDASLLVTLSNKDPLHNQRTLTGGYASTQQQHRVQQQKGLFELGGQHGSARPHGPQQHHGSNTGVYTTPQSGAAQRWQQQGQGHGPQQSWSDGPGRQAAMTQPVGQAYNTPQMQQPGVTSETVVAPFEYKTGKDWPEHRAQVLLYLLLMEDRYQAAVRTGLLWNQQKPTMQAVKYAHHELAALVMHRNRLAAYLVDAARDPPPPLQGSEADRKCNYCSVSSTCALYLAAAAHGSDNAQADLANVDLHPALREKLSTVSPSCAAFFSQWIRLVDLEEAAARSGKADLWAISGPQRERQGGCIARLVLEKDGLDERAAEGARYRYVFRRMSAPSSAPVGATEADAAAVQSEAQDGGLLSAGFAPGDLGVLGLEGRHAAAARVSVADVTKDTITLTSKKEIKFAKLGDTRQPQCQSCGAVAISASATTCCRCSGVVQRVTWRLDRDEAASVFAQMRLNLSLLCVPGAGAGWQGGGAGGRKGGGCDASQARREGHLMQLRKLVIELASPQQGLAHNTLGASSQLSASLASSQLQANPYLREHAHEMNGEQLEAVQRVLAMQDYAILLGMPGTGKTTTIVHVIRALVEARVRILVASYTNSAVDNILLKLIGTPVSFVRIGSAQSVHPGVRGYMPGGAHHPDTSTAGLQELMGRVNVVGCTCLSVHNPLLAGRTFGVCILDEASQVTLPSSIGALALAKSFLLVGDHYQLSPLVVSREASQGGLGVSLFRRLSEAHPQAVVTLRSQYRMAADIMALSNELVYNGRMLCGSDRVATAMINLPGLSKLAGYRSSPVHKSLTASGSSAWPPGLPVPGWLLAALQPESRVVFLDTDSVAGCRELALQDGMSNPGEVRLVHALACALVAAGLPPIEIGVASPYKAQVAALQQALAGLSQAAALPADGSTGAGSQPAGGTESRSVEVLTVDKYQGRDKSAIMLSFVRCNPAHNAGRLLADWQRLNVAITRARTKLLLVGSAATLASMPLLADMLALLRRKGWVTQLPADCLVALPPVPSAATGGSAATPKLR
ncbi:hypothetical protein Agub_g4899 [Astrephomene gubernaculifera]|uniref:DNA helicase n=1 Tax=Astrephomene gubernaculifera TaxID=47775 RepID=A0AAD3DLG3_9CHLO|nr:hypothetical protein Agub_g4899 [Astrephomene gubernaculifera]